MKHSMRFKMTLLLFGMTGGIILSIIFLNTTLLGKYYYKTKQTTMKSVYEEINKLYNDLDYSSYKSSDEEILETIKISLEKICTTNNVSIRIIDFDHYTVFSSGPNSEQQDNILDAYVYSFDLKNSEIIDENENYTLLSTYDSRLSMKTLNLVGEVSKNNFIIMSTTIESFNEGISLSNKLIEYIGIAVMCIGFVVAAIFAKRFTKPITELSRIAEKMSELDFSVKYINDDKSEVGVLGNSMNALADKLEVTISELKSANISLQHDIEKKEEIDEMRKEFVSNVSHELKTPIALIQGYAEGLKEGISDDPESMEFYCDVIMDEASKMNNMVRKLLTLNHIESGTEKVNMERFDIVMLIKSVVNANKLIADKNGTEIIFDEKNPIYVWADEYETEEVMTNYISNAINHSDFEKKIYITLEQRGDNVRINVFNTGKNIPEDELDKVWIKFYKVDKARTREYGGSGIGLSIVKAIVESFNQQCGVYNTEKGVVFWFELDCKS